MSRILQEGSVLFVWDGCQTTFLLFWRSSGCVRGFLGRSPANRKWPSFQRVPFPRMVPNSISGSSAPIPPWTFLPDFPTHGPRLCATLFEAQLPTPPEFQAQLVDVQVQKRWPDTALRRRKEKPWSGHLFEMAGEELDKPALEIEPATRNIKKRALWKLSRRHDFALFGRTWPYLAVICMLHDFVFFSLFWSILLYLALFGIIWLHCDLLLLHRFASCSSFSLFCFTWYYLALFGFCLFGILASLDLVWMYLELFGFIFGFIRPFGFIWLRCACHADCAPRPRARQHPVPLDSCRMLPLPRKHTPRCRKYCACQ